MWISESLIYSTSAEKSSERIPVVMRRLPDGSVSGHL